MFNFFRSQAPKEKPQEDQVAASIQYIVKKNSGETIVDVEVYDYEDESIESLCDLLDTLGRDTFYLDTLNIIKDSLIKEQKEDVLIKIFTRVGDHVRSKLLKAQIEKTKDEPCIQPSDMIK